MWKKILTWANANKLSAASAALIPVLALASITGNFTNNHFIEPYIDSRADSVYTKKQCDRDCQINSRILKIENKDKLRDQFMVQTYYNQKALMTPDAIRRASDEMQKDTLFQRFLTAQGN